MTLQHESIYGAGNIYGSRNPVLPGRTKPEGWDSATAAGVDTGIAGVEYAKRPFVVPMPGGTFLASKNIMSVVRGPLPGSALVTGPDNDSKIMPQPEDFGKSIDDGWEIVGVCSPGYEMIEPRRILEVLDTVTDRVKLGDKAWPVETIALINGGRRMFVSAVVGEVAMFNDPREATNLNLFVTQDFRPGKALDVSLTPITIRCANVWNLAIAKAKTRITIPHVGGAFDRFEAAIRLTKAVETGTAGAIEFLNRLQATPLTEEMVKAFVEDIYPEPKKPAKAKGVGVKVDTVQAVTLENSMGRADKAWNDYENAVARMAERRAHLLGMWELYLDDRNTGLTAYTFVGAAIEHAERIELRGDAGAQNITGVRHTLKSRALAAVLPMIGKN